MIIDTEPQTAAGKVLWHFSMSLDGFVSGPDNSMGWLEHTTASRPGIEEEYMSTTGAILGGRSGWDATPEGVRPYNDWQGPIFILTHHPEDARQAEGVTILNCDVAEAVRICLKAAAGKNVEVFSPTIGAQLLQRGLIDEIDLHVAPVLLGDGVRLFDNPGGEPVHLRRIGEGEPTAEINVRYRPVK